MPRLDESHSNAALMVRIVGDLIVIIVIEEDTFMDAPCLMR